MHVHVQLPNGGIMSVGYPIHPGLQKQIDAGLLKPVAGVAPVSPRPPVGREEEASGTPGASSLPDGGTADPISLDPDPSDPRGAKAGRAPVPAPRNPFDIEPPAADADHAAWAEFAVSQGMSPEEASALSVDEIKGRLVLDT